MAVDLKELLKKYFGYSEYRPLQEEIVQDVLNNKDVFVLMPTGGGKSLCYQIPALITEGVSVVVSPLISLMKDQVDSLRQNGINAAFLNSTLSVEAKRQLAKDLRENKVKMLYIAPEKLTQAAFLKFLLGIDIGLFAIDEAHCISEWGHDFRPDYKKLRMLREAFKDIPIIALTATATRRVQSDIVKSLQLRVPRIYRASFDRPNLHYAVYPKKGSYSMLLDFLAEHKNQSGIIYCLSRNDVESLATSLRDEGYKALPYHAGLPSDRRAENQDRFIKDDVDIIVATIAFGMGIDKPDVRYVIHFNLPSSLEKYYQETGRAGRDGLPSKCLLFWGYGDKTKLSFFIDKKQDEREKDIAYAQLRNIIDFAESTICRRKLVLGYFGEEYEKDNCGNCDNCLNPNEQFDGSELAKKVLSCVCRVRQRFGVRYVAKVLAGSRAKQVTTNKHDSLSTYGIIQDYTIDQVSDFIREIVQKGLLRLTEDKYAVLKLTAKGAAFLKKDEVLMLTIPAKSPIITAEKKPTEYNAELFEKLRRLRKALAEERSLAPYQIFHDGTLYEMCSYFPMSPMSFLQISGVGEMKLETYGSAFLQVIKAFCDEYDISEVSRAGEEHQDWQRKMRRQAKSATVAQTVQLYHSGKTPKEIAKIRKLTVGTIISHIEKAILAGEDVDIRGLVSEEKQQMIEQAMEEIGSKWSTPVREHLKEQVSYDEIRIVRAFMTQKEAE